MRNAAQDFPTPKGIAMNNLQSEVEEAEPLLRDEHGTSTADSDNHSETTFDISKHLAFFCLIFTIKLLAQFTQALLELPLLRLIEYSICLRYYGLNNDLDEDENDCKVADIQNKLALIMGWRTAFDSIPCLLLALTYGRLADYKGRKLVLALSIIGMVFAYSWIMLMCFATTAWPIELVWLSSIFLFIGGGSRIELSMLYTIFSDVVPWQQRSTALFYLHAATHSARLFGPPLGSVLMKFRLWAPFVLAALALGIRLGLVYWIEETSPFLSHEQRLNITTQGDVHQTSAAPSSAPHPSMSKRFKTFLSQSKQARGWRFFRHRGLCILLVCFMFKRIGFASEQLTFQYASETQNRTISSTFWLRITNALGAILVLSLVMPGFTRLSGLQSPRKDIYIAQGSLCILILGFFIIYESDAFAVLAFGMALCGMGEAFEPSLQAIGTYISGEDNHAALFTLISALDVLGDLLGGPIMAGAYMIRDAEGRPRGACFLLSSILFFALLLSTPAINTTRLQIAG